MEGFIFLSITAVQRDAITADTKVKFIYKARNIHWGSLHTEKCILLQNINRYTNARFKQMFLSWCEHTYSRINMRYGMRKLFSSMFWAIFPFIIFTESWQEIWGKTFFSWITRSASQTPEAKALVKTWPQSIIEPRTLSALKRHLRRV